MLTLVQPIDNLDSLRIRKTQHPRSQPHHVSILPMQVQMRMLRLPSQVVVEAPPVRVPREPVARIFVQAVREFIIHQPPDQAEDEEGRPVGRDKRKDRACEHVECLLELQFELSEGGGREAEERERRRCIYAAYPRE